MADRVGQQLGSYRLIRLLGSGGFAEVYLGEHLHLGTQAAIKVLYTRLASKDDVENFEKEARIIAHLKHPHIICVLDYDIEDETPFLVMDYAPAGTMRNKYAKGTVLPLTRIISYVKQCAHALQYAHDQQIIHRDVKPENMLVGRRDELLLSDFGIALVAQSSRYQSTQEIAGTMPYMAPEQIQGKSRPASDQYSLGIVVYEWLSGGRPFRGSLTEIVAQHLAIPPIPLSEKVPTISPDIDQVVLTALEKDPYKRFTNVEAFAIALEQAWQAEKTFDSAPTPRVAVPIPATQITKKVLPLNFSSHPIHLNKEMDSPVMGTADSIFIPAASSATVPKFLSIPQSAPSILTPIREPGALSSSQPAVPSKGSISRRRIMIGLGITGLAVVGGGITWLVRPQRSEVSSFSGLELGTTLFIYHGHTYEVKSVAWSPDGKSIASGSADGTVQVWDVSTGQRQLTYRGHKGAVFSVAWSPDGKSIASGGADETIQVWNALTGHQRLTYAGHHTVQFYPGEPIPAIYSAVWSPDGKFIASGGTDETVQIWDASTGNQRLIYTGHKGVGGITPGVFSVAWSPDGKSIASGGADGTVQVWDALTGDRRLTYTRNQRDVRSVAWSPDGKSIASGGINQGGGDQAIQVWDAKSGNSRLIFPNWAYAIAWSPDSKSIASGSNVSTVQVWDAVTGRLRLTYTGHHSDVLSVAWSPDGKSIASGGADETVQIWKAE